MAGATRVATRRDDKLVFVIIHMHERGAQLIRVCGRRLIESQVEPGAVCAAQHEGHRPDDAVQEDAGDGGCGHVQPRKVLQKSFQELEDDKKKCVGCMAGAGSPSELRCDTKPSSSS